MLRWPRDRFSYDLVTYERELARIRHIDRLDCLELLAQYCSSLLGAS
jgi:hypothetical protein